MDEVLKTRIENCLKELAKNLDISIADIKWGSPDFEIGPGTGIQPAGPTLYPLAVTVGRNRKVIKFTQGELDDCIIPGSQGYTAWQELEHHLKEFFKKFKPSEKRIGF